MIMPCHIACIYNILELKAMKRRVILIRTNREFRLSWEGMGILWWNKPRSCIRIWILISVMLWRKSTLQGHGIICT